MPKNITPEKAIAISKLSVLLACCWPLPPNATKTRIICFKIMRTGCIVSATLLLLPLLYATYLHQDDSIVFIKSICLGTAAIQIIVQTLYSASQYETLQRLVGEMKVFCQEATLEEREVLQEYVNSYGTFYGGCIIWFYISASVLVLGTFCISQPFPTDAEYPFSVDYMPLKFIIFLHQSFALMQCAANVSTNGFGALLLWFSAARFDILKRQLRKATDISSLTVCVRKHQETKRYAKEAALVVRVIAFIATVISACGLVLSGITLLSKQSLVVTIEFSFLTAIGLLEAFMCAWPADHLMNISTDVGQGAYESTWYVQTLKFQKQVLCVLLPQKAVTVSINCVMPILSLKYYCSYLTNAFSAFTALRIVLLDEKAN